MNVETKKSSIQVVIIRLLGELVVKAEATDLPLIMISTFNVPGDRETSYLTSSTLTQAGLAVKKSYDK